TLLGHRELALLLLVLRVQVRVRHGRLCLEGIEPQLTVLEVDVLGREVLSLVRLVVSLDRGIIGRRARKLVGGQYRVAHLALLILELPEPRKLRGREEIRAADRVPELGAPQVVAQLLLEGLGCKSCAQERVARHLRGILTADLESGLAVDGFDQLVVAAPITEITGVLGDECLADQSLEHLVLEPRAYRHRDVGATEALLPLRLLAEPGAARLLQRDLGSARFRGVIRAAEAQVHDAVRAPGGEYDGERTYQDIGDPLALGAPLRALEGVSDTLQHM